MGDFLLDQELAPVLLFVYNRPIYTLKTLQALAANPGVDRTDLVVPEVYGALEESIDQFLLIFRRQP
jgi:hypothetical protein